MKKIIFFFFLNFVIKNIYGGIKYNFSPNFVQFFLKWKDKEIKGNLFVNEKDKKLKIYDIEEKKKNEIYEIVYDENIRIILKISKEKKWEIADLTIENLKNVERYLEIGWETIVDLKEPCFWAGERKVSVGELTETRNYLPEIFPLSTIFDKEFCFAIGFDPSLYFSYINYKVDFTKFPFVFKVSTRMVLESNEKKTITFLLGSFITDWGFLEALHWYYEKYFQYYNIKNIDERGFLSGAVYKIWKSNTIDELKINREICRRLYVGWEWCYAPFKRTGDVYGRKEFWEYEPVRPFGVPFRKLSLEEFHAWRRKKFIEGERLANVLMAFYIPSQIWCEERLAYERYSDSIIKDPTVRCYYDTPWVTGHDNEIRVFPYKTSFGEQSLKDIDDLINDLDLNGFAFDTAEGGGKFYSNEIKGISGKSWDEKGIFVDESVAIAKLMEYIHSKRDKKIIIISNFGSGGLGSYLSATRSDLFMIEAPKIFFNFGCETLERLRYKVGHKPIIIWHPEHPNFGDFVKEDLKKDEYLEILKNIESYSILLYFKYVVLPSVEGSQGFPNIVKILPILVEMVKAGWQPVPAAKSNVGDWVSRAGKELNCFIAVGNQEDKYKKGILEISDFYIGKDKRYIWSNYETDAPLINGFEENFTKVLINLKPKSPLIIKTVGAIRENVNNLKLEVIKKEDVYITEIIIKIDKENGPKNQLTFFFPLSITEYEKGSKTLEEIYYSGKKISFEKMKEMAVVKIFSLKESELVLKYISQNFKISESEILSIPFVQNRKINFYISLKNKNEIMLEICSWLQEYFPIYYQLTEGLKIKSPEIIIEDGIKEMENKFCIKIDIFKDLKIDYIITKNNPNELIIRGKTEKDILNAIMTLLRILDKKYFYPGGFYCWGNEKIVGQFKNWELFGKPLPF